MSEYIFFDPALRDRFIAFASAQGIHPDTRPDKVAGYLVILPDSLPEDIEDALEDEYDQLMDEQQQLVEAEDGEDKTLMGVDITLPDGQACVVRLPPDFARRLCAHFSGDEIRAMVTAIAADIAEPTTGPICCKP